MNIGTKRVQLIHVNGADIPIYGPAPQETELNVGQSLTLVEKIVDPLLRVDFALPFRVRTTVVDAPQSEG